MEIRKRFNQREGGSEGCLGHTHNKEGKRNTERETDRESQCVRDVQATVQRGKGKAERRNILVKVCHAHPYS